MTDILQKAGIYRKKAERIIEKIRVSEAWESIGAEVHPVGSFPMGLLMKHQDLDFHIYTPELKCSDGLKAIERLSESVRVRRLEFRDLAGTEEQCFEWHAWIPDEDGSEWQIDMIQILKGSRYDGYFEHVAERIRAVLTPETKRTILELKNRTQENRHIMGIEYYQAVIRDGVRTWSEFEAWREKHPVSGVVEWCP